MTTTHAETPTAEQTPEITNAIFRQLLDPTVHPLDICDWHNLTLAQLRVIPPCIRTCVPPMLTSSRIFSPISSKLRV